MDSCFQQICYFIGQEHLGYRSSTRKCHSSTCQVGDAIPLLILIILLGIFQFSITGLSVSNIVRFSFLPRKSSSHILLKISILLPRYPNGDLFANHFDKAIDMRIRAFAVSNYTNGGSINLCFYNLTNEVIVPLNRKITILNLRGISGRKPNSMEQNLTLENNCKVVINWWVEMLKIYLMIGFNFILIITTDVCSATKCPKDPICLKKIDTATMEKIIQQWNKVQKNFSHPSCGHVIQKVYVPYVPYLYPFLCSREVATLNVVNLSRFFLISNHPIEMTATQ